MRTRGTIFYQLSAAHETLHIRTLPHHDLPQRLAPCRPRPLPPHPAASGQHRAATAAAAAGDAAAATGQRWCPRQWWTAIARYIHHELQRQSLQMTAVSVVGKEEGAAGSRTAQRNDVRTLNDDPQSPQIRRAPPMLNSGKPRNCHDTIQRKTDFLGEAGVTSSPPSCTYTSQARSRSTNGAQASEVSL